MEDWELRFDEKFPIENYEHSEDGECGCKYMDDEYPCQTALEITNFTIKQMKQFVSSILSKQRKKIESLNKANFTLRKELSSLRR